MLESFKDLVVRSDEATLVEIINEATNTAPTGWSRDPDGEQQLNRFSPSSMRYFSFIWEGPVPPAAGLVLTISHGKLEIANIVPRHQNELSRSEYNRVLDNFAQTVLSPAVTNRNLDVITSSGSLDIREMLSADAYRLLIRFAQTANKGTGSSHPSDRRRWVEFLVRMKRERGRLDSDTLQRWFVEEEGWPEDSSVELAIEYEFAMDLLEVAVG